MVTGLVSYVKKCNSLSEENRKPRELTNANDYQFLASIPNATSPVEAVPLIMRIKCWSTVQFPSFENEPGSEVS